MCFFNFGYKKKLEKTGDRLFDQKVINNILYIHTYTPLLGAIYSDFCLWSI